MKSTPFIDNPEAMNAYEILEKTARPVLLTGKAGTGKSTFIEQAKALSETELILLAPTGVAAQNINGQTIHSFFHLPNRLILPNDEFLSRHKFREDDILMICHADMIIIDEISMVTSAMFDCIDILLKRVCNSKQTFGGKKVLLVGDPFQLPPVVKKEELALIKEIYKSEYFFDSFAFKRLGPLRIELQKNYRQQDEVFFNILNSIRENKDTFRSIRELNKLCYAERGVQKAGVSGKRIQLAFTNKVVDQINSAEISLLPGQEIIFKAEICGKFDMSSCSAEAVLRLKIGARVMLIKNHSSKIYVNGTLGILLSVDEDKISIKNDEGVIFEIKQETWITEKAIIVIRNGRKVVEYEKVGELRQYPLKLAWAITVHKSQGLTFDEVDLLNYSNAFSPAQTYVALSSAGLSRG